MAAPDVRRARAVHEARRDRSLEDRDAVPHVLRACVADEARKGALSEARAAAVVGLQDSEASSGEEGEGREVTGARGDVRAAVRDLRGRTGGLRIESGPLGRTPYSLRYQLGLKDGKRPGRIRRGGSNVAQKKADRWRVSRARTRMTGGGGEPAGRGGRSRMPSICPITKGHSHTPGRNEPGSRERTARHLVTAAPSRGVLSVEPQGVRRHERDAPPLARRWSFRAPRRR